MLAVAIYSIVVGAVASVGDVWAVKIANPVDVACVRLGLWTVRHTFPVGLVFEDEGTRDCAGGRTVIQAEVLIGVGVGVVGTGAETLPGVVVSESLGGNRRAEGHTLAGSRLRVVAIFADTLTCVVNCDTVMSVSDGMVP